MIVIIIDNFIRKISYIFGIEFILIKTICYSKLSKKLGLSSSEGLVVAFPEFVRFAFFEGVLVTNISDKKQEASTVNKPI